MSTCMLLEELTRTQARAAAEEALLVWPVGATEQHGPHLPVGTDTFQVHHLARQAAEQVAATIPVVVAPTLPFGSSHHHLPFGGTMSLGTELWYRVVYDLSKSLVTSGFHRLFILNGHGGNHELVQLAARDLALNHPVSVAAASWWTIAWDALVELDVHVGCRFPGHAGKFETSLVMALRPELVREPLPGHGEWPSTDPRGFVRPYRAEHAGAWQRMDGYTDNPHEADADMGRKYLDTTVNAISAAMIEFYRQSQGVDS